MGIRVKKVMGYGLTNVKSEGWKIADPRINPDSPFFSRDGTLTLAAYINFLEGRKGDRDYGMERYFLRNDDNIKRGHHDPEGCMHWQPEYGLPNVLLLRPVANDDWSRHDDTMDWVEETYLRTKKHAQTSWVRKFRHGFYPYNGSYMDSRDGRRLPDDVMLWIRLREDVEHVDKQIQMLSLRIYRTNVSQDLLDTLTDYLTGQPVVEQIKEKWLELSSLFRRLGMVIEDPTDTEWWNFVVQGANAAPVKAKLSPVEDDDSPTPLATA